VFATAPVFDQRVVQALQQMLNDVGFNIEISVTDMPTYLNIVRSEPSENSELSFGRWSCACQDADGIAYPTLHSGSAWSRVNDPELDELLETARVSLDEQTRKDAYEKVHQIVREKYYILPMYQAAVLYGAASDLTFEPTANESMFLNRMSIAE
jgi:peptide/nickel transport system substrate-binding protein